MGGRCPTREMTGDPLGGRCPTREMTGAPRPGVTLAIPNASRAGFSSSLSSSGARLHALTYEVQISVGDGSARRKRPVSANMADGPLDVTTCSNVSGSFSNQRYHSKGRPTCSPISTPEVSFKRFPKPGMRLLLSTVNALSVVYGDAGRRKDGLDDEDGDRQRWSPRRHINTGHAV